jgi:hypothetical protein
MERGSAGAAREDGFEARREEGAKGEKNFVLCYKYLQKFNVIFSFCALCETLCELCG